jgi:capsular exopolysaccharide synthesis family protein
MSDQEVSYNRDRSASRSAFLSKFDRYRRLFLGKWWVLFILGLLGACVGWAVAVYQDPLYTSFGRMIVNVRLSLPEGSVYTEEISNFVGTQAALMQSGAVVTRAHNRITAVDTTLVMQPVKLKVTVVPRTTIFILQGTGTNTAYVQAFVQACMEEYIALKREMRDQTSDTTLAGLTEEILRLERDLSKADAELVEFQSTNSVVLLQEQGNTAGAYLAMLNQRLASLRSEHELLKRLSLEQNLDRESAGSAQNLGVERERPSTLMESEYLKTKQQLLLMKAEKEELARDLREKHPKMVRLSEDIARLERLLEIFLKQGGEQLESRKNSLAMQIENTERDIKEYDAKTLEVSRKTAEFQRLKANSQRIQALYDKLLATMQTLDVNKEISPESVTIMENASRAIPDRPGLSTQVLIGIGVGVLVAIGLLLLLDRLDDRITTFGELRQVFDEEVLGQVPRERPMGPRGGVALLQPGDERHSFVEAYRNLRSSLFFLSSETERPKSILLTSSVPNEGKSLTSANLAITLANAGMKVLLVDADLRKGAQHSRFAVPSEPGLAEALTQNLRWEEVVHPTKIQGLSLLPRGAITHRSSEFFLNATTKKFLEEAKSKYDTVIVDTAPVMAADDVTSLAPIADGVVFVLRADHTSARVARAAMDSLCQRQAKILGIVFNSVRPSSVDYYYYYKYKDYYSVAHNSKPAPKA